MRVTGERLLYGVSSVVNNMDNCNTTSPLKTKKIMPMELLT
jgi:hypothetical protein